MGFFIKTEEEKKEAYLKRVARKREYMLQRDAEKQAYKEAYSESRINYARQRGKEAGSRPSSIGNILLGPTRVTRPPYKMQSRHSRGWVEQSAFGPKIYRYETVHKKKPRHQVKKQRMGFDYDPVDNWGLLR